MPGLLLFCGAHAPCRLRIALGQDCIQRGTGMQNLPVLLGRAASYLPNRGGDIQNLKEIQ